jgi:hypothetical protein
MSVIDYDSRGNIGDGPRMVTWIKHILQELFPGEQLTDLLQMIGVFAMLIFFGAMRAKFWQDRGSSAVFLTKQRFKACLVRTKMSEIA